MTRPSLAAVALLAVASVASRADAASAEETALFDKGVAALGAGAHDEAIQTFESLADRGLLHPDASYDRCLAYLARVRAGSERPGDLGRAAAAVEETLLLRPDDEEAETALDLIRAEVARRRARTGGGGEVDARPTLERAVVGLASEQVWALLASAASTLLTLGLVLRWRSAHARRPVREGREGAALPERDELLHEGPLHVAAALAVPVGAALFAAFGLLAWGARYLRLTTDVGVIVVPEAHLVTDRGALTGAPPIPEAARVEIGGARGTLVQVRWGAVEGFTQGDAVRRVRGAQ